MKTLNKYILFVCLCLLVFFVFMLLPKYNTFKRTNQNELLDYNLTLDPSKKTNEDFEFPYVKNGYLDFKEAIGFKESAGQYNCVNKHGYLGKYQFGKETLKLLGIYNTSIFLNSSELQEQAFMVNIQRNKWILRNDILRFVGTKISGVDITESGILASAHLAGPGNVKRFLRSYGTNNTADAFGSSILNYMKMFSGFDVTIIEAKHNAKVSD